MSHLSKIFEEAPIKVQNRNGFDLSHLNCGTAKTGQLVPVLCKLLPPNTSVSLGISMNVELPPLATQAMGRVDAICEGFVIPCSILYGGWKTFIQNQQSTDFPASQAPVAFAGGYALPFFDLASSPVDVASFKTLYAKNENLYEYFGMRVPQSTSMTVGDYEISLLPALAYHLIWNTYYRNKQITKSCFAVNPNMSAATTFNAKNVSLVWHSFYVPGDDTAVSGSSGAKFSDTASLTFPDGVSVFSTRQRNYARDYFTAAMPDPQQGGASSLKFSIDTTDETGEFTIGSLRAANALQKFLETNSLSADYAEQMRNRWGVKPIDADFDEPYYLGRVVLPVYQKSVYQTNSFDGAGGMPSGSPNPFVNNGALAGKGASGAFNGEGSICDKFTNTTWAYIMCIFSLVPHAAYGYGINRELLMTKLEHFPAPELQTVGNEEIKSFEVFYDLGTRSSWDFGYIPRYSRFKYMDDEIHGELRPGRTLESFVIQRRLSFPNNHAELTTSFLEIPQDALDSVFAVSTDSMNLSCWYEIYFKFRVSMPLADFCIPTLGDIRDTHTIKTSVGGSRL